MIVQTDSANIEKKLPVKNEPELDSKLKQELIPETTKELLRNNTINLLEDDAVKYFIINSPQYIHFKNGNMVLSGTIEKADKIITSRSTYSNYKISFEYKWLNQNSDSGIEVHRNKGERTEVNLSTKGPPSGSLFSTNNVYFIEDGEKQKIKKLKKRTDNALGEWNILEVICKDTSLSTSINGKHLYTVNDLSVTSGRIRLGIRKKLGIEIRKFELTPLD